MKRLTLLALFAVCLVLPAGAAAKITDHGSTCTLINGGTAVQCQGTLTGLGSQTTTITISVPAGCTNKGGNNPPGQATGSSGPIQPKNGTVTYTATTNPVSCPDDMAPFFGKTATLTASQGGTAVFSETIPIT